MTMLKSLYEATTIASGAKYPTLSMVKPLLHGIEILLDNFNLDLGENDRC